MEPFEGMSGWDGAFRILGPSREYYKTLLPGFRGTPVPEDSFAALLRKTALGAADKVARFLEETWDVETLTDTGETSAENNSSAITLVSHDGGSFLLTGDAGIPALNFAMDAYDRLGMSSTQLKLVQTPHHGSRRNVGPRVLDRMLGPKQHVESRRRVAIVSCAPDGEPKHPSKKVTNGFRRRGTHWTERFLIGRGSESGP
jgi:beta-lactamase superfamily II metal-dependent hydrolase